MTKGLSPLCSPNKKRYVGFMYETVDQEKPIFDAKGIETVRRDSCPATAKILEKSLKILFQTRNLDDVKDYVQKQFSKILNERVNIMDFIFAKEYRGRSGYKPGACVPALEIAKRRAAKDPRSEPLPGERVPYVVVYGPPGLPIIRLVREPDELLNDSTFASMPSITSHVITPALERVFSLMGANVKSCCASCGSPATSSLCDNCLQDSSGTIAILHNKIRKWERNVDNLRQVCTSCTKSNSSVDHCVSVDCPVFLQTGFSQERFISGFILKEDYNS
ncbi:DNA polymerase zeta catalytic subunit [Caerostris extrusa]|uniref:DNA-directed DNA polymerase n=1 Tax=Caerostris extrusa TaxID=172846 RepID=A0AAV4XE38_CAEEX|nr:DNA polymerase zeta catalytic subunit [Caerostris extrusa]